MRDAIRTKATFVLVLAMVQAGMIFLYCCEREDWIVEKIQVQLAPIGKLMEKMANTTSSSEDLLIVVNRMMNSIVSLAGMGGVLGLGNLNIMSNLDGGSYSSKFQQKKLSSNLTSDAEVKAMIKSFSEGSVLYYRRYSLSKVCTQTEFHDNTANAKWRNAFRLKICMDKSVFSNPTNSGLEAKMLTEKDDNSMKSMINFIQIIFSI